MPSVMAIVSKAVFEKEARGLGVGDVWATARYASQNKALAPVGEGGNLYLVTVRPPEQLWLVAVLVAPKASGGEWRSKPNAAAIRAIDGLKSKLRFATGAGIQAKPGALGMSLQTPRVLTSDDIALLDGAAKPAAAKAASKKAAAKAVTPRATPRTRAARGTGPESTGPESAIPRAQLARGTGPTIAADGELPELATVLDRLRANQAGAALVAALAAWRKLRAPALAELVERIAKPIDATLPVLAGEKGELHRTWLDLAAMRRPADLGRLLARVGDAAIPQLRERFELLAGFAPDPRLFAAAIAIPQRYHSYEAGPLLTMAFDLAAQAGDPRARKILDALLAGYLQPEQGDSKAWREHLAKHERRAIKVRDGLPASVTVTAAIAAQIAACTTASKTLELVGEADAFVEPAPAAGGAVDALLAAVLEHPDDDQARAVYADALQERGDPRGEFIALQLQRERDGKLSTAGEKRERELIAQHGRAWIAPLDAVIRPDSIRFARGFLDACRVELKTPAQRKDLPGHPLWATVRELDCEDQVFLTRASLVSLRRATVTAESLGILAAREQPVPLEAVIGRLEMNYGLRMRRGMVAAKRNAWGPAPEVGALVNLRSLQLFGWDGEEQTELTPDGLRWLLDSALGAQLTELDLYAGRGEIALAPWISELTRRVPPLAVKIRFTNGNTASGSTQILVTYDVVRSGARVDVTMTVNHDMVDLRYLSIRGQIEQSLAGLPSTAAPAITVRYVGSKKRSAKGFPSIATLLQQCFPTVAME